MALIFSVDRHKLLFHCLQGCQEAGGLHRGTQREPNAKGYSYQLPPAIDSVQ